MNEHIKQYLLDHYFHLENPQYAVMLKGKWGCGKTYFIKQLLREWKQTEVIYKKELHFFNFIIFQKSYVNRKPRKKEINLKPIYISLNGLKSASEISEKISAEIYPFLHSKFMKLSKSILGGFLKGVAKIDLDLDGNDKKDGSVSLKIDPQSFFSTKDPKIKGNRILIFDDLERSSIPTNEIFGYINHFIEHAECKVILIANEDKIENRKSNKKDEKAKQPENDEFDYNKIKEKLVGQTFTIQPNTINALNSINKENPLLSQVIDFKKEQELIIDFFNASEANNLRILKQSLLDYKRFVDFIDDGFKENNYYDRFLSNLLAYFLIVSLEYKAGKNEVQYFQNIDEIITNEKNTSEISAKYDVLLNRNNFYFSKEIIPIKIIYQFIETGFVDKIMVKQYVWTVSILRDDFTVKWENINRWRWMEDKDLFEKLDGIYTEFSENEIKNIYSILYVSSWLLFFVSEKILNKSDTKIVERAKQLLSKSIDESENNTNDILWLDKVDWKTSFKNIDNKHFKVIRDYVTERLVEKSEAANRRFLIEIFNNNAGTLSQRLKGLEKTVPMKACQYNRLSIFSIVDITIIQNSIINYSNEDLIVLNNFIVDRYFLKEESFDSLVFEDHLIDDIDGLKKLTNYLNHNMPDKVKFPIKFRNLKQLIENVSEVSNKIKKSYVHIPNLRTQKIP
ncbi:MAG: P-loop NTPase fold protein [Salinivirgaceae bacterium]